MMSTKGRRGTDMIHLEDEMSSDEQHALPMRKRTAGGPGHTPMDRIDALRIDKSRSNRDGGTKGGGDEVGSSMYVKCEGPQTRQKSSASPSSSISAIWDPVEEENGHHDDLEDDDEEDDDVDDIDIDLESASMSSAVEGRETMQRDSRSKMVHQSERGKLH